MSTPRHTVCVDLDGTLVEGKWPELGDWMPGAVSALFALADAGYDIVVDTARLSRYDPHTGKQRPQTEIMTDYLEVRKKLDDAGLHFVTIWMSAGKPSAVAYIDDRAIKYTGTATAWRRVLEQVEVMAAAQKKWAVPIEHPRFDV